jgi:hypothetical protein
VAAHREGVKATAAALISQRSGNGGSGRGGQRQGAGGGCSWRAPCKEKGARGEKLGPAATGAL